MLRYSNVELLFCMSTHNLLNMSVNKPSNNGMCLNLPSHNVLNTSVNKPSHKCTYHTSGGNFAGTAKDCRGRYTVLSIFWSWIFAGTHCSEKILGFAKHESVRAFIFGLATRLDFLHLHMVLSYKFLKHVLNSPNNVLQSVKQRTQTGYG